MYSDYQSPATDLDLSRLALGGNDTGHMTIFMNQKKNKDILPPWTRVATLQGVGLAACKTGYYISSDLSTQVTNYTIQSTIGMK